MFSTGTILRIRSLALTIILQVLPIRKILLPWEWLL
jgi:hypothetical protein